MNTQSGSGHDAEVVSVVRNKIGKTLLNDDDLIILSCEEMARTVTYRELDYISR